jgi:hypothetical protein
MQTKIEFEMKNFGYTKENLYTKENRVAQKVKKIYRMTYSSPKYSWSEHPLSEDDQIMYVTKQFASKMPNEIYVMIAYDDSRVVLASEWIEGRRIEDFDVLIETAGPGYDDTTVPHIIFESELEGNEKKKEVTNDKVNDEPYKWSSSLIPDLKMEIDKKNSGVRLTIKSKYGNEENIFIPGDELIEIQHFFHKSVGHFMFGIEPKNTVREVDE